MGFESPNKKFRLKPAGESLGGFPVYERASNEWSPEDVKEFLNRTKKTLGDVAEKVFDVSVDATEGIREAVKRGTLTEAQAKSIHMFFGTAAAVFASTMSPVERGVQMHNETQIESSEDADSNIYVLRYDFDSEAKEATVSESEIDDLEKSLEQLSENNPFTEQVYSNLEWLENEEKENGYVSAILKNANEKVGNQTRMDYIAENISFGDNVPKQAQEFFKNMIVGWCAKEAAFDVDRVSPTGARGPMQFQPDTWVNEMRQDIKDIESFELQTQMAGKYISMLYDRTEDHVKTKRVIKTVKGEEVVAFESYEEGEQAHKKLKSLLGSEEEFVKFMTYATVVSYNQGAYRVGESIKQFMLDFNGKESQYTADELFPEFLTYARASKEGVSAGFGDDGYNYLYMATALDEKMKEKSGKPVRLAMR